ncbi:hypothetical protein [Nocardiopsis salina]|uniref:hypothetical protein n=1 Tax=Nocardiopsis salina TaxID=245836 RepID=UPI001267FDB8|nr:hypothetical protein [Nocardiopsis salina]
MAEKDVAAAGPDNSGATFCVALGALEVLREGLVQRQVSAEVRLPEEAPGEGPPELHASIPGARRPVVVTVVGDRFRWWRGSAAPGGGGGASCPITCPSRAVDMVIQAVNTS